MEQYQYNIIRKHEAELNIGEHELASDMTNAAINLLIKQLQKDVNAKRKKIRGKILHKLGLFGMTKENGQLDFERINEFIMNIGSNNPKKKILNFLTCYELNKIATQVDQMVSKELSK